MQPYIVAERISCGEPAVCNPLPLLLCRISLPDCKAMAKRDGNHASAGFANPVDCRSCSQNPTTLSKGRHLEGIRPD